MGYKLPYSSLKKLEKLAKSHDRVALGNYLLSIYESGYKDGYEKAVKEEDAEKNLAEMYELEIAIKSTEGIGDKLYEKIMDNIKKFCFDIKKEE